MIIAMWTQHRDRGLAERRTRFEPLYAILVAGMTAAACSAPPPPTPSPTPAVSERSPPSGLEGQWEGLLVEPSAATYISMRFERKGAWTGSIDIPGSSDVPLRDIELQGSELRFAMEFSGAAINFEASLDRDRIEGVLRAGNATVPFHVDRIPPLAPPKDRVEAWQQDIDTVATRFAKFDRSFTPTRAERLQKTLSALRARVRQLGDQQIIAELSRAIAISENAHTRLYLLRNRTELRRLPLRVYWFADGLYVVRATTAHRDALGCRVTAIGGHEPKKAHEAVTRLFAGNPSWRLYKSAYFLTSPEILLGVGLIDDMERVALSLACDQKKERIETLAPLPLERKSKPTEAWRSLSPAWQPGPQWHSALPGDAVRTPLYLRNPSAHYWFEFLDGERTLYLHYSRCADMESEKFGDFAERVTQFIADNPVRRIVIDLRFNTGGNLGIGRTFMRKLAEGAPWNKPGRLFVITGRATFSAGLFHAAALRQHGRVRLVGEPVGDVLDTWAEGGNIILPNSRLTVHFANGFHSLSKVPHPEFEPYREDLELDSLAPDIPIQTTWADYIAGRDPALEAILAIPMENSRP